MPNGDRWLVRGRFEKGYDSMKNHSNKMLATLFSVSLAISIGLFLVRGGAIPLEIYGAVEICAFYFPAVPFLFLQMLLCKVTKQKWV